MTGTADLSVTDAVQHQIVLDHPWRRRMYKGASRYILKCCTKTLAELCALEDTIVCKYTPVLEPMSAEAQHISPPCCVSTHRSRVVDPGGSSTFLDHREAVSGIPQMTSLTKVPGHPDLVSVQSSPPPMSECAPL